jgi:hypothetical protein
LNTLLYTRAQMLFNYMTLLVLIDLKHPRGSAQHQSMNACLQPQCQCQYNVVLHWYSTVTSAALVLFDTALTSFTVLPMD